MSFVVFSHHNRAARSLLRIHIFEPFRLHDVMYAVASFRDKIRLVITKTTRTILIIDGAKLLRQLGYLSNIFGLKKRTNFFSNSLSQGTRLETLLLAAIVGRD